MKFCSDWLSDFRATRYEKNGSRVTLMHGNKGKLEIFRISIRTKIRPSSKISNFDSHRNKAKLEHWNVQFAPQKGQAQKFGILICTKVRPSSKISNFDFHRNKAKLKCPSLALLSCISVFVNFLLSRDFWALGKSKLIFFSRFGYGSNNIILVILGIYMVI